MARGGTAAALRFIPTQIMQGFCDSMKFRQGLHGVCPGWGWCFKQLNSRYPKRQLKTKQHAHVFTETLCVLMYVLYSEKTHRIGWKVQEHTPGSLANPLVDISFPW